MTYAEILDHASAVERRLALLNQSNDDEPITAIELNEYQQVKLRTCSSNPTEVEGTSYQRCGGGRRVIRKQIGGV